MPSILQAVIGNIKVQLLSFNVFNDVLLDVLLGAIEVISILGRIVLLLQKWHSEFFFLFLLKAIYYLSKISLSNEF